MSCDFAVSVRLVSIDGTTLLAELQDPTNGLKVLNDLDEPEWDEATGRARAFYMHGSAPTGLPRVLDGQMRVLVRVSGDTWAQCQTRRAALYTAWRSEPTFYVDVELEGVTTRYTAERQSWAPEPITSSVLARNAQEVLLVFLVQPFPEVTIA